MSFAVALLFAASGAGAMQPAPPPTAKGSPPAAPPTAKGSLTAPPPAAPPAAPGAPGGASTTPPAGAATQLPSAPPPSSGSAGAPPAPPAGSAAGLPPQPPAPGGAAPGSAAGPPPGYGPPQGYPPPGYYPPPPGWNPGPWAPGSYGTAPLSEEETKPRRVWYGWQHLIVLGTSALLIPLSSATGSTELGWLSFGGFVLGGPVTHWANGNAGKGFISLGLNAGLTLGGGLLGAAMVCASDDGWACSLVGFAIGGGLGLATANVIDIAALEYEIRQPETYDYTRAPRLRFRVAPQVGFAHDRATLGLGGSF